MRGASAHLRPHKNCRWAVSCRVELIARLRVADGTLNFIYQKDPFERLHGRFTTERSFKEWRRVAEELALEEAIR